MVYIEAPTGKVCYNSRQQLNCTSIEAMSKCVWQMSRSEEVPLILGPGSEVTLSDTCTELSTVTLLKTNGYWSGVLFNAIMSETGLHLHYCDFFLYLIFQEHTAAFLSAGT